MSDEAQETQEAQEVEGAPEPKEDPRSALSDAGVDAQIEVAVVPEETVSLHFSLDPSDDKDAITSVSTSFVSIKNGMVEHNYAGSTQQTLVNPTANQGFAGDMGVDAAVFSPKDDEILAAVVAGTIRDADGATRNFYFQKDFDLA